MSKKIKRNVDRIVAAALAVLLIVQLLPVNTFAEDSTNEEQQQTESMVETVTIKGTVYNKTANGIVNNEANVVVALLDQDGNSVMAEDRNPITATVVDGVYEISGLEKGKIYYISVASDQYIDMDKLLV